MRRVLCIGIALAVAATFVQAQDSKKILETFQRNFAIASLDVKIQILQDAATGKTAPDMGPLFLQAVDFVYDNAGLIPTDARFSQLAAIGAEQIGAVRYAPGRFSLWKLFQAGVDSETLGKAATALGIVGAGDEEIIADLNRYVEGQNAIFATGKTPDMVVIAASLQALGKLGSPSSFPVLFGAMYLGYPDKVTSMARDSLLAIKGDFKEMILGVIKSRSMPEKKLALQMALDGEKLTDDQKSQVAEYALDIGLHSSASDAAGKTVMREMRFVAAGALGARKSSHASPLLVEHLDMSIGEFDKGLIDQNHLLNAITSLGAMGTHEAAVRLTQYLVLINSYTEKNKGYTTEVVVTVVASLGALGDKVAFDDLMYTQYLNYSAAVKKAARTALDSLKW
jgi:hypothetical protein